MTEEARPPTRDDLRDELFVLLDRALPHGDVDREDVWRCADALLAEFSIVARGDTPPAPAEIMSDIQTAARFLRASSWPGEMAEEMERRSHRLDAFADSMNAPRGVTPDPQTADAAFAEWWEAQYGPNVTPRYAFMAAWNARAAVEDGDVLDAAGRLAAAASCYVQCSDLAIAEDRAQCQASLSSAVLAWRAAVGDRPPTP